MKIGAIAESFRKPFKEAIAQIATLKLDGVQMYADTRTVNADMTLLQIKEIKNILEESKIEGEVFGRPKHFYSIYKNL